MTQIDPNDLDRYDTANGYARRFGIPVRPIRHDVRTGRLPAVRIGAWSRIKLADFLHWLEKHRVQAEPLRRAANDEGGSGTHA